MSESNVTLPKTFEGGSAGGCVLLFAWAFMIPMAFGAYQSLTQEVGLDATTTGVLVGSLWLVASLAIYTFFNSMTITTVDRHSLTVSHQYVVGPLRSRPKKDYEILWSSVSEARDVEQRRLTKHGNVNSSFHLVVGDKTIHSAQFGTMARDGKYAEFLAAVRAAIGDRLVTKEDLGELEAPLQRLVDRRIAVRHGDRARDHAEDQDHSGTPPG